jgi:hypothetical protein
MVFEKLFPPLRPPLRTFYKTKKPVRFAFRHNGSVISGTIPSHFICDGFTVPAYSALQTIVDRLFWRSWLVHDYLVTESPVYVDGVKRRPTIEEINSVLPLFARPFLDAFPVFLSYTRYRRGFNEFSPTSVQVLSNAYKSLLLG